MLASMCKLKCGRLLREVGKEPLPKKFSHFCVLFYFCGYFHYVCLFVLRLPIPASNSGEGWDSPTMFWSADITGGLPLNIYLNHVLYFQGHAVDFNWWWS